MPVTIPPEYEFKGEWQITQRNSVTTALTVVAVVVFILSFILGIVLRGLVRGIWEGGISVKTPAFIAIVLGIIVAVVIVHEGIHALLFLVAGGRPRFGFKMVSRFFPVVYTTCEIPMTRDCYIMVCLGPFIAITLALLAVAVLANNNNVVVLSLTAMAMNASGSIVDIIVANRVSKHIRTVLFKDREDGFAWYRLTNRPNR
jgi:hypothetical protein